MVPVGGIARVLEHIFLSSVITYDRIVDNNSDSEINWKALLKKRDFDQLTGFGGAKRRSEGASILGPRYLTSPNL